MPKYWHCFIWPRAYQASLCRDRGAVATSEALPTLRQEVHTLVNTLLVVYLLLRSDALAWLAAWLWGRVLSVSGMHTVLLRTPPSKALDICVLRVQIGNVDQKAAEPSLSI